MNKLAEWLVQGVDAAAFGWTNRRMWSVYGEHFRKEGEELDKETELIKVEATKGGAVNVVARHPIVPLLATELAGMLDEAGVENYVELDMALPLDRSRGRGMFVRVTVQWANGLSPAEKASKLEKKVEMIEAMLAQKDERYQQLFGFAREVFETHFDGGIADDDIEVMGREHGLLERVTMTEPCGEGCNCVWLMDEGEEWDCNRIVGWLWDGDTAVAGDNEQ